MRLLIYGMNYAPELIGIAKFTTEMCEWLAARGHEVRVVSGYPYYPDWKVAPPYSGARYSREQRAGVTVIRCPLYVPSNPTASRRLFHHASFAASSAPVVTWVASQFQPHVIFTIAPSQSVIPAALTAARIANARSWLHIQDFEVDAAFELGFLSSRWLRRSAERIEQAALARFDRVSTISPRMMERLIRKRVEPSRIIELPNWVDTSFIRPANPTASLRGELLIPPDAIVALYSGSLVLKQGLENVIEAASVLNRSHPRIMFVICGSGPRRAHLIERAKSLQNVRFLDLQPPERLPGLLSAANVHLLPQRAEVEDLVLPSKLAAMLSSGVPIIATVKPGTQVALDIEGAGIVVTPDDPEALATAILRLANDADLRAKLGEAGREIAKKRWEAQAILSRLEQALLAFTKLPRPATPLGSPERKAR